MEFKSEKDLEDALVEYQLYEIVCFIDRKPKHEYYRQFNLPGYGIIDILSIYYDFTKESPQIDITIIELKNNSILPKDVAQISRYEVGLREYIKATFPGVYKHVNIKGILLGSHIRKTDDVQYLVSNIDWLSVCSFKFGLKGMVINKAVLCLPKNHPKFHKKTMGNLRKSFLNERRNYKEGIFEEDGEK